MTEGTCQTYDTTIAQQYMQTTLNKAMVVINTVDSAAERKILKLIAKPNLCSFSKKKKA